MGSHRAAAAAENSTARRVCCESIMHTAAEGELVVRKADDGRVAYASADAKA